MKLVYLYVRQFPPYKDQSFSLDSNYHCELIGTTLHITKGTNPLPDNFFTTEKKDREFGRVSVSAVIGRNGSGKTSFARFLQKVFFGAKDFEFILVFEKSPGEVYVWYNWKDGNIAATAGKNLGVRKPINVNKPKVRSKISSQLSDCFETIYYSPFYSLGAPQFEDGCSFYDVSTYGMMRKDIKAFTDGRRNQPFSGSLTMDSAYNVREVERILRFVARVEELNKELTEELRMNDLPVINKVMVTWNKQAREEIIGYFRNEKNKLSNKDGGDAAKALWYEQIVNRLEKFNSHDIGLNAVVTFLGCLWRDYDKDESNPEYVSFSQESAKIVSWMLGILDNKSIDFKDRIKKSINQVKRNLYFPRDLWITYNPNEGEVAFKNLLNLLDVCYQDGYLCENNEDVLEFDLSDNQSREALLAIVNLHARVRVSCDILTFSFEPRLSAGEYSMYSLFARLNDYFDEYHERVNEKFGSRPVSSSYLDCWHSGQVLLLDEAETALHPEWQRKLVRNVIWMLEHFFPSERVHVIFFSHSPILLSDIPIGNITFLLDEESDQAQIDDLKELKNTFGANIFDLYRLPFGLSNGPVGIFAKEKIDKVLKEIADFIKDEKPIGDSTKFVIRNMGDSYFRDYIDSIPGLKV